MASISHRIQQPSITQIIDNRSALNNYRHPPQALKRKPHTFPSKKSQKLTQIQTPTLPTLQLNQPITSSPQILQTPPRPTPKKYLPPHPHAHPNKKPSRHSSGKKKPSLLLSLSLSREKPSPQTRGVARGGGTVTMGKFKLWTPPCRCRGAHARRRRRRPPAGARSIGPRPRAAGLRRGRRP